MMAGYVSCIQFCSLAVLLCSLAIGLSYWQLFLPEPVTKTSEPSEPDIEWSEPSHDKLDFSCTTSVQTAVCVLRNVCYRPPNGRDTFRHEFYISSNYKSLPTDPVAYLMSPDIFPQSAVYLNYQPGLHHPDTSYEQEDAFLFMRFKPDNLMHVIHDDVLPVYSTLSRVYNTLSYPYGVRILFADDYGEMPHDELVQSLTSFPLSYKEWKQTRCFRKLIVGFNNLSVWYQYGFNKLQGPVPHNQTYILELVETLFPTSTTPNSQIVIFSRADTRRILNEVELSSTLARVFSTRVVMVDLGTHTLTEITQEVSKAKLVIGMHGALFSSIIWLPPHTIVLELFPYAIPAAHYTPYKTLAEIKRLKYISWSNTHIENTVGHVDYPQEYGGLMYLTQTERDRIISEREVVAQECCDDPSWLYHIYQDTRVDVNEILKLLPSELH